VVFLALLLLSEKPDVAGLAPLAIVLALLAGGLFWQAAELVRTLRRRTRLAIARILSDGRPRDRDELVRELCLRLRPLRSPPLRWLHLPDRALREMTQQGLLAMVAGKYTAATHN
jgi:hypothetical protein